MLTGKPVGTCRQLNIVGLGAKDDAGAAKELAELKELCIEELGRRSLSILIKDQGLYTVTLLHPPILALPTLHSLYPTALPPC